MRRSLVAMPTVVVLLIGSVAVGASGRPAGATRQLAAPPGGVTGLTVERPVPGQPPITRDLALVAAANGWTLAQARAQHDTAERMRGLLREITDRLPGQRVGGALNERPGGVPT